MEIEAKAYKEFLLTFKYGGFPNQRLGQASATIPLYTRCLIGL